MTADKMIHFSFHLKDFLYIFNSTIKGIDYSDSCLLIGTDIKKEAPILSSRIRQRFLSSQKFIRS